MLPRIKLAPGGLDRAIALSDHPSAYALARAYGISPAHLYNLARERRDPGEQTIAVLLHAAKRPDFYDIFTLTDD